MLQGGANCIVANGPAILTTPGPLSIYALKNFAGNTLQFAHDGIVIVAVLIVFQVPVTWTIVLFPLSVAIVALNGIAVGLWLGPLCARYRDVGQLVTSVARILFFFTPIFWVPGQLSNAQILALAGWNPLAYFLQVLRAPLTGEPITPILVLGTLAFTTVNCLVALIKFGHSRDRLAYWL